MIANPVHADEECQHLHKIISNGFETCTDCGLSTEILDYEHNQVSGFINQPSGYNNNNRSGSSKEPKIKLNYNQRFYNTVQYQEKVCKIYSTLIFTALERMKISRNQLMINEIMKYVSIITKRRYAVGKNFKIIIAIIIHELFKHYNIYREINEIVGALIIDDGPIIEKNLTDSAMALRNAGKTKSYPKYFRLQKKIALEFPEIFMQETFEQKTKKAIMQVIDTIKHYELLDPILHDFERIFSLLDSKNFPKGIAAGLILYRTPEEDRKYVSEQCMDILHICRPVVKKYMKLITELLKK